MIWSGYPFDLFIATVVITGVFYEWIKLSRRYKGWFFCGLIYLSFAMIGLGAYLMSHKRFFLGLLLTTWVTDSSAYLVGSTWGGLKLAPSISPNKTWSGSLGGLVIGTIAGSFIFSFILTADQTLSYRGAHLFAAMIPLTAFFVVVAQAGDLLESWAKRSLGVKDSGNIIPGHGGFLDRLDSLIAIGFLLFLGIAFSHFIPVLARLM